MLVVYQGGLPEWYVRRSRYEIHDSALSIAEVLPETSVSVAKA